MDIGYFTKKVYMESKGSTIYGSKKDNATLWAMVMIFKILDKGSMRDMGGALGQKNIFDLVKIMKFVLRV